MVCTLRVPVLQSSLLTPRRAGCTCRIGGGIAGPRTPSHRHPGTMRLATATTRATRGQPQPTGATTKSEKSKLSGNYIIAADRLPTPTFMPRAHVTTWRTLLCELDSERCDRMTQSDNRKIRRRLEKDTNIRILNRHNHVPVRCPDTACCVQKHGGQKSMGRHMFGRPTT